MSHTDDGKLPLFPVWRQAEADLLAEGMTFGSLITDERLKQAFHIGEPKSIADVTRLQLMMLSHTESLRESLLLNHNMRLTRTAKLGYTVVPPEQQTRVSMEERIGEIRRAMTKLRREISHVATDKLNDEQRKENADSIAKIGALGSLMRKKLKGPDQ